MFFDVRIDDEVFELNVPDDLISQAKDFFEKMDDDMSKGWQMNQAWVEAPSTLQRCQIAADKLFSALENEDHNMGRMMAAYICSHMPNIKTLEIDPSGEMANHHFTTTDSGGISASTVPGAGAIDPLRQAAMVTAEKQVSQVFKVGRQYRFTTFNPQSENWDESPAISDKTQAESLRIQAVNERAAEIMGQHG